MEAIPQARLVAAAIGLAIALLGYLAARLVLETAKLQQQRKEFNAREKQKTNAIFVENKVLAFYREVVETVRSNKLKNVRGGVAAGLMEKLGQTSQIVEDYSRLSGDNANVLYPWERFCFNFRTFFGAKRINNNDTVKEFKRDHLDGLIVETLRTLNPDFEEHKAKGIFDSEFKSLANKELRGATFDSSQVRERASG